MPKGFNNTPGLMKPERPAAPSLTRQAQLDKVEDDYRNYREDVNKRYCENEPKVVKQFEAEIKRLRNEI